MSNSRVLAMLLRRPANAENPNKVQLRERDARRGFTNSGDTRHERDIVALKQAAMDNKRERWRGEARDSVPVTRVYQAIGDVPGGGAETGEVTRRSNSDITWNRVTQTWDRVTEVSYSQTPIARIVREVKISTTNRHKGGNF